MDAITSYYTSYNETANRTTQPQASAATQTRNRIRTTGEDSLAEEQVASDHVQVQLDHFNKIIFSISETSTASYFRFAGQNTCSQWTENK